MEIVLVLSVTAAPDNVRPGNNVVLAPTVIAAFEPMMVPRNVFVAPIEVVPAGTQNTLVFEAFAAPPNDTVIVAAEVSAPVERKM